LNIVPFFRGGASDRYGGAEAQAAFIAGALRDAGHDVHLVVSDLHEGDQVPFPVENAFDPRAGIPGLRFLHPRWTGIARALERADADVYLQRNAGMITGLTAMFCRKNDKVFVYAGGSDVDFSPRRVSINNVRDRMLHSYGLKLCDGFVVQNESQKQAALSRFDKPVRVIPNGVHPLVAAEKNSREYVLWIGGWRSIKRPDIILDIAERNMGCSRYDSA